MPNRPDPNEKLVKVFDSEQESEALVVRGLLQSAGIDSLLTSIAAEQDLFPVGGVVIRVRQEQADAARRLIEEYRHEGEVEGELSEGPPDVA